MKVLVHNFSRGKYNLGVEKIRNWSVATGHQLVEGFSADKAFLSALFTWDLKELCMVARALKPNADVEIGGPAACDRNGGRGHPTLTIRKDFQGLTGERTRRFKGRNLWSVLLVAQSLESNQKDGSTGRGCSSSRIAASCTCVTTAAGTSNLIPVTS